MKIVFFCTFFTILIPISLSRQIKSLQKRELCTNDEACENPCNGINCNVCSNNVCCNSISCNTCVTRCSQQCQTSCCKNNCVHKCSDCPQKNCEKKCRDPDPEPESEFKKIVVTEKIELIPSNNHETFNITTHINLTNVITNYNNITSPIYVNTHNINNIDLKSFNSGKIEPVSDVSCGQSCSNTTYVVNETKTENCCYVMHPRTCFEDNGKIRCVIRKHKECSDICTSPVVIIEPRPEPQMVAIPHPQCHFVRNYPYLYCGQYSRRECGCGYQCNGQYNSGMCHGNVECSINCRRNMNCVQNFGMNCA